MSRSRTSSLASTGTPIPLDMCLFRGLPLLLLLPWLSVPLLSFSTEAADRLSVGESLTGNQTLVSEDGQFEFGFFSPAGNPNSSYYIGIWYKQIPVQTIVWVMNRDYPVSNLSSAELTVVPGGNLVLLLNGELPKKSIWSSSNSTSTSNEATVAVLLDTGNLVLRSQQLGNLSNIIWQSFEHPTDTLVPGSWVGMNKRTGAYQNLLSWRNTIDPSMGSYTGQIDPYGSGQYTFMWNGTTIYHYIGPWTGQRFSSIPEMGISSRYKFIFVNNEEEISFSFHVTNKSTVSRMVMRPNGQFTLYTWSKESLQWLLHWAAPKQCEVYSACGPFGLCDVANSQYCRCLSGFEPVSPNDWSEGCARKTSSRCSNNASADGFLPVKNVRMSKNDFSVAGAESPEACASACLNNCSCMAYTYKASCSMWGNSLRNIQQMPNGDIEASTLFLRVAVDDLVVGNHGSSTKGRDAIVAVSLVVVLAALCLLAAYIRRHAKTTWHDGSLLVFNHRYLVRCTKNYSEKLGMGSFGSVYKGMLRDHTAIAVKRLEGSVQGEKQFRAEVKTLGTVHHTNLVRLHEFCATRHDRLLVYEYMPNGSLASTLLGPSSRLLNWGTRFRIMVGVARGLAYLHEQCQERIVHCDVKPENILLDAKFCPKVADFGMAKLIGRDFSVLTTARGTLGYLAPEWIQGLPITSKADVYSYGMTLLELISGQRNRDTVRGVGYFPLWAATKVCEGRFLAILDERLAGDADLEELSRACKVAAWCIQESEALRLTMGQVVQILEGSLKVDVAPVPTYLEQLCADDSCTF